MASIKDVAKLAGVSPGTVSKALNNYPSISEETKKKVNLAADTLNYTPNIVAASLASKSRNKIGIIVSVNNHRQAIDEINMQYIMGANSKCIDLGFEISVIFKDSISDMSEADLKKYILSRGITALIMFGISKDDHNIHNLIKQETFKVVVVDSDFVNKTTSCVTVDHYNGQRDVFLELVKQNPLDYKPNVLYISGRDDGYVTELRQKAIIDLKKELDFYLDIEHGDYSEKKAYDIISDDSLKYDYIVCASDLMAIGVINKLKKLDIFKPVCGFDGISLMGYCGQEMLTCVQDFYNVAQTAVLEVKNLSNKKPGKITLLDYSIDSFNYEDVIF